MLVAQISDGHFELGGLFNGLKVNVDEYVEIIDKFSKLDLSKSKFLNEDGTKNWDAISEAIGGADERAMSYFRTLEDGNGTIDNSSASVQGMSAHLKATGQAFNFAAVKATLLNTALNAGIFLVVSLAIQGVTKAIDNYVNRAKYAAEAMEEAQQKIDDAQNSLKNMTTTLSENKDRFLELSKGVSEFSENLHLSEEDYTEYLSISNELAELFPTLVSGYDEQGNALLAIGSNADETNEKLQELLETQKAVAQQTLIDNMDKVADGIYYEVEATKNEINGLQEQLSLLQKDYEDVNINLASSNGLVSFRAEDYLKYGEAMKKALSAANIEFTETTAAGNDTAIQLISWSPQQLEKAQEFYDAFLETENRYYKATENGLKKDIAEKEKAFETSYSKMTKNLQAWVKDNYNYQYLSDDSSKIVDAIIPEINWKEVNESGIPLMTAWDYQNYVEENIINPLMQVPEEHKAEIDNMFQQLLSFEDGDLDVLQFAEELQSRLNELGIKINISPIIADEQDAKNRLQNSIDSIAEGGSADFFTSSGKRVDAEDYKTLQEYTKDFDKEQIELWNSSTLGAKNAVEAIAMYEDALKSASDVDGNNLLNFEDVFNSSDFSDTKQSLIDLAKAGKLTNKALSSDDYSDFIDKLEEIGISAEEAKTEILSLLDATEKLSGASKSISGLENAYNEFKEKGYVLAETIEAIPDVFRELETYDFDVFESIIGNPKANNDEIQDAFNDIVTAYISEMAVLSDVSETESQRFIANLREMGVTNAEEVVNSVLALNDSMKATAKEAESTAQEINEFLVNTTGKAASATNDLTNCTWSEINALIEEGNKFGYTTDMIKEFALQKMYANRENLDVSDDISGLIMLAETLGLCSEAVASYKKTVELANQGHGGGYGQAEAEAKALAKKLKNELSSIYSTKYTTPTYKPASSSSSSSSSSSKEAEKTAETYDWIEKLLERIQSRIDKLDKTASSTYRAWSTRNKALLDELKEVNGEIKAQQKAYDTYMAKANSVGLSEHYKQLVQNGDYKIEDITDDNVKDNIKAYEEWYNKAMDCSDAITDLKDRISELGMTQFENLVTQYEDQLSSYAHEVEMLQTYIDQTEAKGYDVSADYYKRLISVQESNIEGLKREYESLKESLHSSVDTGKVVAYSESWYEMVDSIRNVQKSLEDANSSLIEYQNNLRELEWNKFDKFAEKVSQITEESDFLISLMSDEKMFTEEGITDEGQATLGLHAINYNTYLTKADEYAREIQKINGELADDPSNNTLLERRQELLDLQQQSILASEDEKQAMKDLVSEGYDVFLESLQKIIDKRKDMLKDIKDLHNFEKSISEQTEEVARLEKILKAYEGDNSEEARAKIQEYKVSLEEAESALEETEYDKYIQDQEQMLDDLYSQAEEWINQRLDDLSQLVSDVIDSTNENASEINETIKESADDVGYTISSKLANAFNSAGDGISNLVSDYNDNFLETMTTLQASVDAIRSLIAGSSDSTASDKIASVGQSEKDISTTKGTWTKNDDGNWNYYKDGNQVKDSWTKYDKDNKWYHLDNEGNMSTNTWIKNKSGTWSYVNDLGQALTGWHKLDWQGSKDWYSFDDEGNMLENQWIDDYFVAKSGKMLTNTWIGHNGKYYWVGEDGKWLDKEGWSLDYKPNDGLPLYEYAKGSKRIPKDQLAWTQEEGTEVIHRASDGALLTPLGQGDMVFTNEASRKLWEFSQDPEGYMAKLGLSGLKPVEFAIPNISSMTKMPEIQRVAPNQNVNIQLGDIQMYGVNNPQEFAKQLRNTITTDTKTQKLLTEKIGSSFLGRTDRSNFYR